ncbi:MAG: peptidoglycan DD-metalloendopeptidase family protein [Clostridium sp.]|uniref:murein hydrolase activator EnvC family protein n=1 Tax=Clostridium sp. TaxID=1506 RepID=UPI0030257F79
MNNRFKFIASLIVSCSLLTSTVIADDLSNAKDKSQNIEKEIENDKAKVADLKENKESMLSEISELDDELQGLYAEVDQLKSQISTSTEKIEELEAKSSELKVEVEKNKDLMSKRMRVLYKSNGTGYLEVLLNANGFSDFLQKLDTITTVINYNNEVVEEFKANKQELETTLADTTKEKNTLEQAKAVVDGSVEDLNVKKSRKSELMAKVENDIQTSEKLLAQNEAEFNEILNSITAMETAASRPNRGDETTPSGGNGNSSSGGQTTPPPSTNGLYSITNGTRYSITSPYGYRNGPFAGEGEFHTGIDIGAPYGSAVTSLKAGTVTFAGVMNGYGNVVVVNHGDISTLYAHNSSLSVGVGQSVAGGQQIAVVGSTGWSTGPHIHFEVINSGGSRMDPTSYYVN